MPTPEELRNPFATEPEPLYIEMSVGDPAPVEDPETRCLMRLTGVCCVVVAGVYIAAYVLSRL